MVTCRSCIASSRALWTFAGARLISSANTKLAKTGPLRTTKSSCFWLYIKVPIRSAGSKSGVNCMRLNLPCIVCASVFIASVLARPGTPSSNICPLASKPISRRSVICFCPTITRFISIVIRSVKALSRWMRSLSSRMSVISAIVVNTA